MLLKKEIIFNMTMALNFNNSHIFKSCEGSCVATSDDTVSTNVIKLYYPIVPMMHFKFTYTNALRKNRKISTSLTFKDMIVIAFEDELQLLMKN